MVNKQCFPLASVFDVNLRLAVAAPRPHEIVDGKTRAPDFKPSSFRVPVPAFHAAGRAFRAGEWKGVLSMAVNEGLATSTPSLARAMNFDGNKPFCRWGKETATSVRHSPDVSRKWSLVAERVFQPASLE
jgi:hypothetical protein